MKTRIKMDGVYYELQPPDIDGDGVIGGTEKISRITSQDVTNINQTTELGDSLKELNQDELDTNKMSGIDLRANLYPTEVTYILGLDSLVVLGVLPQKCLGFTRQKKRLSVSINGKGREQIVDLVSGKREGDKEKGLVGGFKEGLKGFFGGKT